MLYFQMNSMGADGGAKVRRRKGERFSSECVLPTVRHSQTELVRFYCYIIAYKNIITNGVIPTVELASECSKNVVFQDDSAPFHRTVSVSI